MGVGHERKCFCCEALIGYEECRDCPGWCASCGKCEKHCPGTGVCTR